MNVSATEKGSSFKTGWIQIVNQSDLYPTSALPPSPKDKKRMTASLHTRGYTQNKYLLSSKSSVAGLAEIRIEEKDANTSRKDHPNCSTNSGNGNTCASFVVSDQNGYIRHRHTSRHVDVTPLPSLFARELADNTHTTSKSQHYTAPTSSISYSQPTSHPTRMQLHQTTKAVTNPPRHVFAVAHS